MRRLVDFFLSNRWLVAALLLVLIIGGITVMLHLPLEAFPDLTNNQVVVTVQCPGMSPVEVEQLVTYPIETSMMGMPKLQMVRSTSKLDLSMVTVIFDDSMDKYLVRQLVAERINQVQSRIPAGLQPQMNPMSTAFGEVYQYTVAAPNMSLMQIKTLHDWVIRYALLTIPGVSEINSWGGETKQYTAEVDPENLRRFNLTLHDVVTAVTNNNANFGGSYIEHAEQQYTVRGLGRAQSIDDLGNIVVSTTNGVPVLLKQVASIQTEPLPRHGAVMRNGQGETVSGMVIILRGENGQKIIKEIKAKIASLKLPNGAKIIPFYDQSDVIDATTATVRRNLIEAAVLVIVILLIFLGDWRAALVVAFTIPLSLLFGFLGMDLFGISVNLMSLGAIDFGTIVDGSVVMTENCMHRLENGGAGKPLIYVVREAAQEVARPVIFGVLIIIAVYLPVLTLQSLEGRMFRPMAVTVVSALAGSLLLALFVVPTLCTIALRHRARKLAEAEQHKASSRPGWFDRLRAAYGRSLTRSEGHRKPILIVSVVLIILALGSLKFIGTEFMPTLDEGSMVVTSKRLPGIALSESVTIGDQIEKTIKAQPGVTSIVTKLGRPDLATEAMGEYESDSYLNFTPQLQNASAKEKQRFTDDLQHSLDKIPGVTYEITQPMQMRMDETITGTRGDVALKIFGEDLDTLEQMAHSAEKIISGVQGASETQMEIISGAQELQVRIDRQEAARYGVNVSDIQEVIETLYGSKQLSEMLLGEERFPIAIRLPADIRNDPERLRSLQIKTPQGELVRLDQVAEVKTVGGPILINREQAHRRAVVMSNVSGRDLGSFVKDCKSAVAAKLPLPPGYRLEWGGQYENQQRAQQRLLIVFPVSLLIISALLYATFQNAKQMLLILCIVPLALVGGVAALWLRGINLNLSACVGFIALFGIAVLNGVVMVSHINSLRKDGKEMEEAVHSGASDRLRPVLITALVASLGFVPMAISTSRGAEIERPLATVVIGGLITATALTLYVLPLLYPLFSKNAIAEAESHA
ncbi:efflux RND transporter permease subunit [Terriglobus aquaticus]|uniref:Efflux RND transporter permease subunit n=1 Tax=Terriglobus aquaticus TaxID=940139 RepID=A0ABW9KJ25_9BACT|nr:CusA/CzcA family heavy metal efflux RND transporter [Terriglobus aquaticus]